MSAALVIVAPTDAQLRAAAFCPPSTRMGLLS